LRDGSIEEKYQFIDQTIDRVLYWKLKRKEYKRANPNRKYTSFDIKLLEKTDELHKRLNSMATKEILRREFEVFGCKGYQNIAQISSSHINNLRKSEVYRSSWVNYTKSRQVPIGVTQPPENYGNPGSLRVDTVHQRAIYHINSVDEITQFEIVVGVPEICERYLEPALEVLLEQFPFIVFDFHSDRGSEYINQGLTGKINTYYRNFFNPYLNFHRPCVYATRTIISSNGRERRVYDQTMTPYDKLKEISRLKGKNFLKPGITFDKLDIIAYEYSDNEFAETMREKENKLFRLIMEAQQQRGSHSKFRP